MNLDDMRKRRDRRLRREILRVLYLGKAHFPTGWMGGTSLVDSVNTGIAPDQIIEDESHALGLCRDLVAKGLIEEKLLTRRNWETFGLRFTTYRITDRGISLHLETGPVDADVADDRVTEN
jgi:hypothetical protein